MKQILICLLLLILAGGCQTVMDNHSIVKSVSATNFRDYKYYIEVDNGETYISGYIYTNIHYQPGDTIHLTK